MTPALARKIVAVVLATLFTGGMGWAFAMERRVSSVEAKVEAIWDDVRETKQEVRRLVNYLIGKQSE